ncbi:MAG: outer membrane protein assembly factor BamC [Thioalkalivibrio sp.]|nr:MAG: outer membrane protein assembly factor BamC [Thioalkalivibrio sp.]
MKTRRTPRTLHDLRKTLPITTVALTLALAGCSTPGGQAEGPRYAATPAAEEPLELPPNLIAPGMDRAFRIPDVPGERVSARELERDPRRTERTVTDTAVILPDSPDVQLRRDGQVRWLHVDAVPEALWPRLRQFWREQNLTLARDEPEVGIMETEWAEDRAGIPLGGTRGLLRRALGTVYDAGTRDRYRLRVERSNGATEIFISHRGAVERADAEGQGARWFMADPDPELEAEMLNRLTVFLTTGDTGAVARAEEVELERNGRVELVERDDQLVLSLHGEPDALWRRLGLALDRTGLMVDEQNRRDGTFFVTYRPDIVDPDARRAGLISRMFGADRDEATARMDERFQVRMIENGRDLQVEALSIDGEPLSTRDERFVLELIQPQLH